MEVQTCKTLRRKHRAKFNDIGLGNDFLDMAPKAQATKEKVDKLDFMKIKKYYASNDTTNRVKRQPTEWEKIVANHISDKGLISRIYRKPQSSTTATKKFKNGKST